MAQQEDRTDQIATSKEWGPPILRRLSIAATSQRGGTKGTMNEGQGKGKGDSGMIFVS